MDKLTVWFDGSCPLCRREMGLMKRLDRRGAIDFIDVAASPEADCPIGRAELLAGFMRGKMADCCRAPAPSRRCGARSLFCARLDSSPEYR
jgi:hypothetical protein